MSSYEIAKAIIDEWERLEGETMREGHRFTMIELIVSAIDNARHAEEDEK